MRYLVALFLMVIALPAHASDAQLIARAVDALTSQLVDGVAVEDKKARSVVPTGIQGEVAAFFTIEGFGGGNNYQFYMALFSPAYNAAGGRYKRYQLIAFAEVGEKTWRHVVFGKITRTKNGIKISTMEYGPEDPWCCPKIPAEAAYLIEHSSFIEVPLDSPRLGGPLN